MFSRNFSKNLLMFTGLLLSCSYGTTTYAASYDSDRQDPEETSAEIFMNAAEKGNVELVRAYLKNNTVDLREAWQDHNGLNDLSVGEFSLVLAVIGGHDEIVAQLIKAKVPVDFQYSNELEPDLDAHPISFAAALGNNTIIQWLLAAGVDIDELSAIEETPLMTALRYNAPISTIKLLLDSGADVAKTITEDSESSNEAEVGQQAPHIAAEMGNLEAFNLLLQHGAQIDIADTTRPLLIYAAMGGNTTIIRHLLQRETNINIQEDVSKNTALIAAASKGNLDACRLLIQSGATIDDVDDENKTALIAAASIGNGAIVQALLNAYAELEIKDRNGYTALAHAARCQKHEHAFEVLLRAGANIHVTDTNGQTILMHASSNKAVPRIIQLLLNVDEGLNPEDSRLLDDENSLTLEVGESIQHPFQAPLFFNNTNSMATLNATDQYGVTALMCAAYNGNLEAVKALLKHKVDIDATDYLNLTAISHAFMQINTSIIKLLLNRGAIPPTQLELQKVGTERYAEINRCIDDTKPYYKAYTQAAKKFLYATVGAYPQSVVWGMLYGHAEEQRRSKKLVKQAIPGNRRKRPALPLRTSRKNKKSKGSNNAQSRD